MSKRIMNEVMYIANELNCPVFYTDTDSIHCYFDDIPKIEEKYKEVFNKELRGNQLEQFHNDFELKDAVGDVYAVKSIYLDKKSYLDKVQGVDKDGNIINEYHVRLKGITEARHKTEAKQYVGENNM